MAVIRPPKIKMSKIQTIKSWCDANKLSLHKVEERFVIQKDKYSILVWVDSSTGSITIKSGSKNGIGQYSREFIFEHSKPEVIKAVGEMLFLASTLVKNYGRSRKNKIK